MRTLYIVVVAAIVNPNLLLCVSAPNKKVFDKLSTTCTSVATYILSNVLTLPVVRACVRVCVCILVVYRCSSGRYYF